MLKKQKQGDEQGRQFSWLWTSGRRTWRIPVSTGFIGAFLNAWAVELCTWSCLLICREQHSCWANLCTVVRYEKGSYTSRGRAIKKNRLWQWRRKLARRNGQKADLFLYIFCHLSSIHIDFFLLPPWEKKQGVKRWGALLIRKPSLTWCHHRTRVQNVQIGLSPKNVE